MSARDLRMRRQPFDEQFGQRCEIADVGLIVPEKKLQRAGVAPLPLLPETHRIPSVQALQFGVTGNSDLRFDGFQAAS